MSTHPPQVTGSAIRALHEWDTHGLTPVFEREEILTQTAAWTNLEDIMLSE